MKNYQEIENAFGEKTILLTEGMTIHSIPCDLNNSDYQRYLRWLENPDAEEGGTL